MQHPLNILFYIKESKTIHTRKPQKFSLSQAPIKLNSFLFFVPFAIFIWDTQLQFLTILSSYFLCTTKRKSKIKLKDFHRFVNFFFSSLFQTRHAFAFYLKTHLQFQCWKLMTFYSRDNTLFILTCKLKSFVIRKEKKNILFFSL